MPVEPLPPQTAEPPSPLDIETDSASLPEAPPPQRGFARAAGRGLSWLTLSFLAGKAFTFIAQIALGVLLLDEDFGIFAIATSVATFAKVFHDGGIAQLLIQRGEGEFRRLAGPAFWIGMCFSVTAGGALALAAPAVAYVYGVPELSMLLWIVAASLLLAGPAQVARAKLRMDLRFRALAIISIGSFAIRQFGAVVLAYQGFGARSFVLPILGVAIYESITMLLATRVKLWRESPRLDLWREMLASSLWVVLSTFFQGFLLYGDYLVLGLIIPTYVVGQYYFGYQLTLQVSVLMAMNLIYVLMPVLSRLAGEPARQAQALLRTFRISILVLAPLSLAFAVTIEPIEALVWNHKWTAAVPLMQIFAIVAPLRVFSSNVHTMLNSRGEFRTVAWLSLLEGLNLMAFAGAAALLVGPNLTALAIIIATSQGLFNLTLSFVYMRRWGISAADFCRAILPGWTVAVVIAAATFAFSRIALSGVHPLGVVLGNGLFFTVGYVAVMRLLYARHIIDLISIIPRKLALILRRVLWLNETQGSAAEF